MFASRAAAAVAKAACGASSPVIRQVSTVSRGSVAVFSRASVRVSAVQRGFASAKETKPAPAQPQGESLEKIKSSLVSLVNEELSARKVQDTDESVLWDAAQKWAEESGFVVTEDAEGIVTMTKKVGNHTVVVTFNPVEEPEEGEQEQGYQDEEEEGEEEHVHGPHCRHGHQHGAVKGEEGEEGEQPPQLESGQKELNFDVEVKFGDRGSLSLFAFAGDDNRLYVDHLAIKEGTGETAKVREFDWYNLGDDTQDRLYDFFDKLSIDDQLANYVKEATAKAESNREVEFLSSFKSLLSTK